MGHHDRRKKAGAGNLALGKARRTRKHTRMIDQIVLEDMLPEATQMLLN